MGAIQFYKDFDFEYAVMQTVSPLVRRIVARNPGPFTGDRPGGEGLRMVRKRLELAYASGRATLDVAQSQGGRTVAELVVPLEGPQRETPA